MKSFHDVSIKRKLVLILFTIVVFALLLQSITLVYNHISVLRDNIVRNLSVLASAIGSTNRAAILFDDEKRGKRILSSLSEENQIIFAAIYDSKNNLWVTYTKDKGISFEPPTLETNGQLITESGIEIVQNILLEGEVIGKIYLKASTSELNSQIQKYLNLVIGIFLLILLISIPLSMFLQKFISEPILALATTADNVSNLKDYSLRAYYKGNDELGVLYAGFNEMLTQIQNRNEKLEQYGAKLEDLVKERTIELEAAQKELMNKERLAVIGTLSAMVSHEIRNPLGTMRNTIFGIRQLMSENKYTIEPELERIERNIIRCDNIIEELLSFARAPGGDFEPTRIDDWLNELIDEQRIPEYIFVQRNLVSDIIVNIDRESFRRAVINIILNAVQAMTARKENLLKGLVKNKNSKLIVESRIAENRIEICVSDDGEGIPQESLEKIFEPLYSTKSFGVGLGLPIVKGIMEQHSGGIEVENLVDMGTRFTLWLPLKGTKFKS